MVLLSRGIEWNGSINDVFEADSIKHVTNLNNSDKDFLCLRHSNFLMISL